MHFLVRYFLILIQISLKYVLRDPINNKPIGSDNVLVSSRRQAMISTNDGLVYRRIYASFGLNELSGINQIDRHRVPNVFNILMET